MNFMYNQQYEAKVRALRESISEENWNSYVSMHERPHRFDALEAVHHRLSGSEYWDLLAAIWSDSENIWQIGYKRVRRFLSRHPEHRGCFMDEDEKKLLKKLPSQIRVFRGHQKPNQKGFSWTLAYTTAKWFGRRYATAGHARVSQGVVQKSDIIGLVLSRNEMEIVVDPRYVQDIQIMKPIPRPAYMESILHELMEQFRLYGRTAHGKDHWNKVDRNAVELCRLVPEADLLVARWFAIFHDSCRQDEGSDPKHGHRAATLLTTKYKNGMLGLTEEQFTKLEFACRHHNGSKPVTDPTIGICFDADRLDIIRVGVVPNPKLLSTEAAKGLIGVI
jgi:hypothetical protein